MGCCRGTTTSRCTESSDYLGGHTHTHDVTQDGVRYAVDTGFIVFNRRHYPLLHGLFDELGVASRATTMSFSAHNARTGLEYNAGTLNGLFCQRRNLLSPRFYGMVRDLLRFYREAPALLADAGNNTRLGDYLEQHDYGAMFRDEHIVPMASAPVVFTCAADPALSRALPRAVHGQPSDAAGQ